MTWNTASFWSTYDWKARGEEWSESWGGSEAQWFGSLFPRLHRFLPANRILEIAPGFGRWTHYLLPTCRELLGIDVSSDCVAACRERFRAARHASFSQNDGLSLTDAKDGSFDLVFSFDSLVHADIDVMASYVPQILQKLTDQGVAFVHHSNLLQFNGSIGTPHGRAPSVSARKIADLVKRNRGKILVQEMINWGGEDMHDCLTLFARDSHKAGQGRLIKNNRFMDEAFIIRDFQSVYSGSGLLDVVADGNDVAVSSGKGESDK